MQRRSRNILFASVILAFVVISPLLVLYALGYRYDEDFGTLRRTATISLEFRPGEAEVFLDDVSLGSKREKTLLQGLKGGERTVKILKDGYQPWSHTFQTEVGNVSFADGIILMKKTLEPEPLLDQSVASTLSSREHERLFFVATREQASVLTVANQSDLRILKELPLEMVLAVISNEATLDLAKGIWLTGGTWMVFPYTNKDQTFLLGWNTRTNSLYDIAVFSEGADDFYATPQEDTLGIVDGDEIAFMNLATGETSTNADTFFRYNRTLRTISIERQGDAIMCTLGERTKLLPDFRAIASVPCAAYDAMAFDNYLALKSRDDASLFLYNFSEKSLELLAEEIRDFQWAHDAATPSLFYSKDNELWNVQPDSSSQKIVTRLSSPITTFLPHPLGHYVFFLHESKLSAGEVSLPGESSVFSWTLETPLQHLMLAADENMLLVTTPSGEKQETIQELTLYEE